MSKTGELGGETDAQTVQPCLGYIKELSAVPFGIAAICARTPVSTDECQQHKAKDFLLRHQMPTKSEGLTNTSLAEAAENEIASPVPWTDNSKLALLRKN